MPDRLEELQGRLAELTQRLEGFERRLAVLEQAGGAHANAPRPATSPPAEGPGPALPALPGGLVPLLGRTLVVLGGAYLFRAITDAGVIPAAGGVAAGLAYATWWLVAADRAAGVGARTSAVFHGLASGLIAYPLVWETTSRFGLIAPGTGVLLLLACYALGLAVAWRRLLAPIAWLATLLALATAFGLLLGTHHLAATSAAFLGIAAGVELTARRDRWLGLRWPAAFAVDAALALTVTLATRSGGVPEGYPPLPAAAVAGLGLALPLLYLVSIGSRTLAQNRPIRVFEIVQATAALLIGFGGTVRVLDHAGGNPAVVALLAMLLGLAGYATGFAFIDRRAGRGRNFYSYTTFAFLLLVFATALVLRDAPLALAWAGMALVLLGLGARFDRITLRFHGALLLTAAALASGLIAAAADGVLGAEAGPWRPLAPVALGVLLTLALGYGLLTPRGAAPEASSAALPRLLVAAVLAWSVLGLAARALGVAIAHAPGAEADAAALSVVRTALLAGLALGSAWLGARRSLPELRWLVYPLLVAGGAQLLIEDLRHGRALTLFLCLALYGGALIAAPRLLRDGS
jgi:hypothetical protein